MKRSNSMEDQLRSWKARQPSPRVKRALFGDQDKSSTLLDEIMHVSRWAPSVALVVMVLCLGILLFPTSGTGGFYLPSFPVFDSNTLRQAVYHQTYSHRPLDHWEREIFDSTNLPHFNSSSTSALILRTNGTLH